MTPVSPDAGPGMKRERRVAVLLPCYNEELTIGKVVADFRQALPHADVYVFDNCSEDDTARVAKQAGATVVRSPRRGKGNVVRHMFREVDADIYLMADGDDTYPADAAPELIRFRDESDADMVVGNRLKHCGQGAFRTFHVLGNKIIAKVISVLFRAPVADVLSGYRVLTGRLVRNLHLKSTGFEIETEITLQSLMSGRAVKEVPVAYGSRPKGSTSKLNTWTDGLLVFKIIVLIFKDYKPLQFFLALSSTCFVLGLVAGWYPVADYVTTRFVSHVPLALLAAALEIMAAVFFGIGLILDSIRKYHMETREAISSLYDALERRKDR